MIRVPPFGDGDDLTTEFLSALSNAIAELQHYMVDSVSGNLYRAGTSLTVPMEAVDQVQNNSGAARAAFDVLGISDSWFDATDPNFKVGMRVLVGITPAAGTHEGRFVVLKAPLAAGAVGPAVAAGITICQVAVADEDEADYAEITNGQAGYLTAGLTGSARILWREGGTGTQWAIVRLGHPAGGDALPDPDEEYEVLQAHGNPLAFIVQQLRLRVLVADPSTPANGEVWVRS